MWELIEKDEGRYATSDRLSVPGGWIVRTIIFTNNLGIHNAQTFVPDPEHSWILEKPQTQSSKNQIDNAQPDKPPNIVYLDGIPYDLNKDWARRAYEEIKNTRVGWFDRLTGVTKTQQNNLNNDTGF